MTKSFPDGLVLTMKTLRNGLRCNIMDVELLPDASHALWDGLRLMWCLAWCMAGSQYAFECLCTNQIPVATLPYPPATL